MGAGEDREDEGDGVRERWGGCRDVACYVSTLPVPCSLFPVPCSLFLDIRRSLLLKGSEYDE